MKCHLASSPALVLALLAGCHPQPQPDVAVPAAAEPTGPTERSDTDLPPMQRHLQDAVGFDVEIVAQQAVSVDETVTRTFVAFTANGSDYCRAQLPQQSGECSYDGSPGTLPWESVEYLGFAVLESGQADTFEVRHFRLMNGVGYLAVGGRPISEAPGSAWSQWPRRHTYYAKVDVEKFTLEDADGDGTAEILAYVAYSDVEAERGYEDEIEEEYYEEEDEEEEDGGYGLSVEDATRYPYRDRRLILLREDLSIEFDAGLYHRTLVLDPGGSVDPDILRVDYAFEPDRIVVHWCEVDPSVTALEHECSLDIICDSPTARVVLPYEPATDSYGEKQVETLRPLVERLDRKRCSAGK